MIREKVEDYVRTIPDFPKEGIMFRDITTVLSDADGLKLAIDKMQELLADCDFDIIAGAESAVLFSARRLPITCISRSC